MISFVFLSFIAFLVAILPVYLWGYGASRLLDTPWNRRRFILGIIIGGFSVGIVWLFSYVTSIQHIYILFGSILFVGLLSLIVFLMIHWGSIFARGVLQKVATTHIITILMLLILVSVGSVYIPWSIILILSTFPLLISSLVEEWSKHLMSIGLMSQDFRFSRSDIILFTIFVVLGFIFIENILYLIQWNFSLSTWIFRSFFSLSAHLISSILCAYAWWKALSYEPFSWQYIGIFTTGFILAVMVHLIYNTILTQGSILGLCIYMIVGYIVTTQWILIEKIRTE